MSDFGPNELHDFFQEKILHAKVSFERALDCKHTEFDDLYPYMNEQPQFFWYKRYVAWAELLTVVRLASDLHIDWTIPFSDRQVGFINEKVLQGKVLDHWYSEEDNRQSETLSQMEE
ncbi:hypothetical protein [Brevibacillus fulvus]|uniref:Uncharacterized protein n=1 Tax=Brevibacillus fulvus TaxID=1125967 RepID=A0A939BSR4_9BACL|nr:hypothetical protein [Brevibacillus fulvus]MBM7590748.1 hypothetical protein [Brevibacillus fulvus]